MSTDIPTTPIRLRKAEYLRIAAGRGLDDYLSLARALHLAPTTVARVMEGKCGPGPKFVANSMHLFGVTFEAVFDTVPDPRLAVAA
jgi:transcriptional regulator with XRE-family HTH domain